MFGFRKLFFIGEFDRLDAINVSRSFEDNIRLLNFLDRRGGTNVLSLDCFNIL